MLTYNTRVIFQSQEEKERILKTLEMQRFAFNEASKAHFGAAKNSIVDLHAKFYRKFRAENPNSLADITIQAEQECLSAYRSIKSNKHEIDKPIEKKKLSCRLNKNLYTPNWFERKIKLTASGGRRIWVEFAVYPKLQKMIDNYDIADPLIFERNGDIWLSLSFRVEEKPVRGDKIIGVDLGMRIIAATSEGKLIQDKKFNHDKRKLRHLKRELRSKGTKSAKRHLKKLRRKERNKNKNQSHLVANEILKTDADVIVLEDLTNIKQKKNKYENKNAISQVPFYQLRTILEYKAAYMGKRVQVIDPKFTSQIDFRTGKKSGERKGRRYYGKDGVVLDAELNAANNIALKLRNKHPNSIIATCNALDGQALVTKPNVPASCGTSPRL
ncbi:MAG: transposase [Kiritimatiellia bacterium]|jgi:IS605 OrfB family transposase